jgi:PKD repeat protein
MLNVDLPGVLENDTDIESDPLTAVKVSGPGNGTLTLNANGSFTYQPYSCFVGTDTFTYHANDGQANSNNATVSIDVARVNHNPTARAGGPYRADLGSGLMLNGSGSDPDSSCGDSIVSYAWMIAGNLAVFGASPILTAPQIDGLGKGSYPVVLTVTDRYGGTGTASTTLDIYDNRPVARFIAAPNPAGCSQSIFFDGRESSAGRPDRSIVDYSWDFGDTTSGNGSIVSHAYSAFGHYSVVLTVTDNNVPAKTDTESLTIIVNQGNLAPIADPGGPYTADLGSGLVLNGSGSYDPNQACGDLIVSYEWDLRDDGSYDLTGPAPVLSAELINALGLGTHTIRLRVKDSFDAITTATTTLSIYNNQPVARSTANPNPAACNQPVAFDGRGSSIDRPDRHIVDYSWVFGDGLNGNGSTISHAYSAFGTYTATLTITDNNVPPKTASSTVNVQVSAGNSAPVANAGGPYTADLHSGFTLNGTGSTDPNAGCGDHIASYAWLIAGSIALSGPTPTLTAGQIDGLGVGTSWPVQLTVTDSFGASGSTTATLHIYENQPYANFAANPNPAACSQTITFNASSSSHGRPVDRSIASYSWAFGDSGSGAGIITTHAYSVFGIYPVTLTVTDNNVPPKTSTKIVSIAVNQGNLAPVANAGGPYHADLDSEFTLNGSGSSDPNANCGDRIVSYEWDIDNNGTYDLTGVAPVLSAAMIDALGVGSHTIRLRVTDTFTATGTATATLTIYENHPVASFTANPNPTGCNQSISFDASGSSHTSPNHSIAGYSWTFGDGGSAAGMIVNHAYACGSYTATLTVTDNNVPPKTDSTTITINAINNAPVVTGIPDQTIAEGSSFATINLDDYVTDADNTDDQMTWTYSGNIALTVNITARVATIGIPNADWNGSETITFRATDPGTLFGADAATFTMTAVNDAPVLSAIGSKSVDELTTLTFTATATDADLPTNTLTFSLVGVPSGAAITPGGDFTWIPTEAQGPGSYTFTVKVCDNGSPVECDQEAITVTVNEVIVTHGISLVPGWNLVSFNVQPKNTSPATVLSGIAGKYDLVYAWDATGGHAGSGNWMKYAPGVPPYANSLNSLDETMGFWVHVTTASTLNVVGDAPTTTYITLSTAAGGWNLVGYPSSVNRNLPAALSAHGVGTDFSLVYAYHAYDTADLWKLFGIGTPDFANDLKFLSPGWGYWVKVTVTHTWDVKYLAD